MNWQTAAALSGLVMLASAAKAETPNISTVDVRTSAPIDWMRRPSTEDIQRYYPASALQRRLEGSATISCSVDARRGYFQDCLQVSENPQGHGFGDAALRMKPLFRLAVRRSADDAAIAPATPVTFEVRFRAPAAPPR